MVVKNSIYLCQLIPFYHFWENYVTMINVIHKIKKCNNDQMYATAVNVIQIVKIRNFVFIIKKCDTKKTQLYIYTL